MSYKVELPPRLKIHHVFYVNNLKPCHEDKEDPGRGISKRAPTIVVTSYNKKVDYIMADRVMRKNNFKPYTEYLVKWKGLPESEASWEPANTLWQFQKQIEQFRAGGSTRTSATLVGENVTPSLMESPSLDHMEANDPMGVYVRRWEDSRDLERPLFARRMWKVLEDSGEVHTCVEEYGGRRLS